MRSSSTGGVSSSSSQPKAVLAATATMHFRTVRRSRDWGKALLRVEPGPDLGSGARQRRRRRGRLGCDFGAGCSPVAVPRPPLSHRRNLSPNTRSCSEFAVGRAHLRAESFSRARQWRPVAAVLEGVGSFSGIPRFSRQTRPALCRGWRWRWFRRFSFSFRCCWCCGSRSPWRARGVARAVGSRAALGNSFSRGR